MEEQEKWHGTAGGYTNHLCRCEECRAAWAEYTRGARARRKAEGADSAWQNPVVERFWPQVEKTEGCWNWTGQTSFGYGRLRVGDRTLQAHRVSFEMSCGPIPEGLHIDHVCHNRGCVKPDHLRIVTQKQNNENQNGVTARNTSGVLGVFWNSRVNKWEASVTHNYKKILVGRFEDIEVAEAAVIAKRNKLFTHNDQDRKAK